MGKQTTMAGVMIRSVIKESKRLFEESLTNTLGLGIDHPILLALNGESISTFNDLPMLSHEDIDDLTYTTYIENEEENTANQNVLFKGHRGWIKALIAFICYCPMLKIGRRKMYVFNTHLTSVVVGVFGGGFGCLL